MALRRAIGSGCAVVSQTWRNGTFPRICASNRSTDIFRASGMPFIQQYRHLMMDETPSSEEKLAGEASRRHARDKPNVFQKIIDGEVKADVVFEDEQCMAFRDVNPVAPIHIIVIPRKPIPCLSESTDADAPLLGHLLSVARKVAATEELADGFRIVMNDGRHGSQSIYHLHVHIIGGRQMRWPPG